MKTMKSEPPFEITSEPQSWRIKLEAIGTSQSDAAANALKVIGMMMNIPNGRGYSCGGTDGNASGRWEAIP